ncbi:MAG: hypothetical protein Q4F31_08420 [Eubacteriales bacterium]|nr:hypothetical protein [Eubacteriales bacterium]
MKKVICALFELLMIMALAGCGDNDVSKAQNASANSVSSVMQQQKEPAADVDLTKLSSTMVYSEVYNMMSAPEDYLGKTVRMNGQFALYQATDSDGQPVPDQSYFACVIADATACCQQGLEFILGGNEKYPEDYPELGADITVIGEFRTYMEDQYQYCHLVNARFE